MVGHKAVGDDRRFVWGAVAAQQAQEEEPVLLVEEDVLVIDPTIVDVVVVVNSRLNFSSHGWEEKKPGF
jgi:hypothetical protein